MESSKIIKARLVELLESSDLIFNKLKENQLELMENEVRIAGSTGESTEVQQMVSNHRKNIAISYLMNDDLIKNQIRISSLYHIVKIMGLDLGFSETELKRLEGTTQNNLTHFVVLKGELVSRDENLEKSIVDRIEANVKTNKVLLDKIRSVENGKKD